MTTKKINLYVIIGLGGIILMRDRTLENEKLQYSIFIISVLLTLFGLYMYWKENRKEE